MYTKTATLTLHTASKQNTKIEVNRGVLTLCTLVKSIKDVNLHVLF